MTARAKRLRLLRVAVVDDHEREEDFMERVFHRAPDMELVGFFTSHAALLDVWDDIRPDVALIDVRWQPDPEELEPETRRWDEFRTVAQQGAMTFALSVSQEARDIINAGRSGAVGYLRKHEGDRIADLIRGATKGVPPAPTAAEAMAYLNHVNDLANQLTPREFEVIELIAEGLHPPEIASDWGIDAKTVNGHIASIRAKLGLYGYGAIGAWAARNGLA